MTPEQLVFVALCNGCKRLRIRAERKKLELLRSSNRRSGKTAAMLAIIGALYPGQRAVAVRPLPTVVYSADGTRRRIVQR